MVDYAWTEREMRYIHRFKENVSEYYSNKTTVARVKELAIIIEEQINILNEIFGIPMDDIACIYRLAKESK